MRTVKNKFLLYTYDIVLRIYCAERLKPVASESSMIRNIKAKVEALPNTRIKKLWSGGTAGQDVDLLIVTHGLACFYEIKVPGNVPTPWQHNRLEWWRKAGADVGWFDTVEDCVKRVAEVANKGALMQRMVSQ